MSEYEIFNDEEESVEIVPETKKGKKEKKVAVKEKAEKNGCACSGVIKEYFKGGYLPIGLSILAIFFSLFVKFLPVFGFSGFIVGSIFFFIGFSCVFSALIIETISMLKTNKVQFNVSLVLIILAFFVLFI